MSQFNFSFGSCYHILQTGNNQQALFRDDSDYDYFLDLFRKYLWPITDLYAYCLLPTHFHLLFRVKNKKKIGYVYRTEDMLGGQLSTLLEVYTRRVTGSIGSRCSFFDGSSTREIPLARNLICKLVVYIHMNPQLHGIVTDFRYWPYSSCFSYLRQDRRSMVAKDLLLDPAYHTAIIKQQNNGGLRDGLR